MHRRVTERQIFGRHFKGMSSNFNCFGTYLTGCKINSRAGCDGLSAREPPNAMRNGSGVTGDDVNIPISDAQLFSADLCKECLESLTHGGRPCRDGHFAGAAYLYGA